ncbi:PQQ-binding-like beta-propeller repeat protein [Neorhodopirellula pilleata]|uniref:Outer membrane biogenesis protein BamB n=1 Tax=Neorhodopirellula pilleata TaxID=2714738 RepID=A0A5C6A2C2_9BACT|nr:PQQ-binding-like beta-propeller repeat protein [Neorhodopirellula pilleata]TWT93566.1 outer membrane biogenesis protein BamB [Neorhodopirellula pilleata]
MLTSLKIASGGIVAVIMMSTGSFGVLLHADDWTGWMGNARDGVYRESGIVDRIDDSGLPILWRTPIGGGYAGPSVADGRVYVFDYVRQAGDAFNSPDQRANLTGQERVTCLDEKTGAPIWVHDYECPYSISYPAGPRCTPTIDGDHVYTLGSEGDLHCLEAANGRVVWHLSLKKDLNADVPIWGFAAHPLVDGDLLYTMVGGRGQGIVAFDKKTGQVRWKQLDTVAGYCPPSIIEAAGVRQLIVYSPSGVDALDPQIGTPLWHIDIEPLYEMSITRPMKDGNLLYVSGIRTESVLMKLGTDSPSATDVWRGERDHSVFCSNSTPLFVDGVIYGTDCNEGSLIAVDSSNGERLWSTFAATRPEEERFVKHGTAFITRIGDTDRYFLFSEIGDLVMAELTRSGYQELGRMHVIEPTGEAFGREVVWSHPAYANRTAYIRNDQEVVAVSLAK